MSRKPTKEERRRQQAMERMRDSLRVRLGEIEQLLADARHATLHHYYQLGKLLVDVKDNPQEYGDDAWELLEAALPAQRRTLRNAMLFAKHFSEKEFNQLLELRDETTGFALTWGHVIYVVTMDDESLRTSLLRQAFEQRLDPSSFHGLVKEVLGRGSRSNAGGRPATRPANLAAALRQAINTTRRWITKFEVYRGLAEEGQTSIFTEAVEASAQDEKVFDLLLEVSDLLIELADEVRAAKKEADKAVRDAERLRRERAREAHTRERVFN